MDKKPFHRSLKTSRFLINFSIMECRSPVHELSPKNFLKEGRYRH